jgi:hypothetical protein
VPQLASASVINDMTVTARAGADGAVVEALIEDREGLPVSTAVVQAALRTVKGCQLPVDPQERDRVGCLAADDLLDGIQGGGIGEPGILSGLRKRTKRTLPLGGVVTSCSMAQVTSRQPRLGA